MTRHVRLASTHLGLQAGVNDLPDEFNLPKGTTEIHVVIERDTRANAGLPHVIDDTGYLKVELLRCKDGKSWKADGGAFEARGGVYTTVDDNEDEYDEPILDGKFQVKEDGYVYRLRITTENAQSFVTQVHYLVDPAGRPARDTHNSIGVVDTDSASGTSVSSLTTPSITQSGTNKACTVIGSYYNAASRTFSSCKWGGSGGTDFTSQLYQTTHTYGMRQAGYFANNGVLTADGTVYMALSGTASNFQISVCSWNTVDQSTPTLATWNDVGQQFGTGTSSLSTNITSANGNRVHLQGTGYTSYGPPTFTLTGTSPTQIQAVSGLYGGKAGYYSPTGSTHSIGFSVSSIKTYDAPYAMASAISLKEASAGSPVDIDPDDMAVGVSLGQPTLSQVHAITPNNLSVATTLSQPTVDSSESIDPADMSVGTALTEPSIGHTYNIDPNDLSVATTLSQPALSQVHAIDTDDLAVGVSLTESDVTAGGDPPEGNVDFDCAVALKLALRNMSYDGGDTSTSGFGLQYAYKIGSGSYSAWLDVELGDEPDFNVDWYLEAGWPYEFDDDGDDFTPNTIVFVKTRAVNSFGSGAESAAKAFKIHDDWHTTGARRHSPSAAVGHASAGYDVTTADHHEGPVTTNGVDRLLMLFNDVAYGEETIDVLLHTAEFNGDAMTKLYSYHQDGREESDTSGSGWGGSEVFYLVNPDTGQHTLEVDQITPTTQKSLWLAASALEYVNQADPIASYRLRLSDDTSPEHDGISNIPFDATIDVLNPSPSGPRRNIHLPRAVASMDEFIYVLLGAYGNGISGTIDANTFGEAGGSGTAWGSHTSTPARITDCEPADTNLDIFCGCGSGNEDMIRLAAYAPGTVPATLPVFSPVWTKGFSSYLTIGQFAIRPTPNMISNLAVPFASSGAIDWECDIACNHGDILLAVTSETDPAPDEQQVQDEIDSLGSSDYDDTLHLLETYTLTEGEVSALGGTIEASLAGLAPGDYRLTAVYQQQQAFKGGTGTLQAAMHVLFTVTAVEIDPSDLAVGVSLTQPTLSQVHSIAPANLAVATSLTQPAISETHAIDPDDLAVGVSLTQPAVTQLHIIDPDDLSVITTITIPVISQVHAIDPDDMSIGVSLSGSSIDFGTVVRITDLSVFGLPGPTSDIPGKQLLNVDIRMMADWRATLEVDMPMPHNIIITMFYGDISLTYYTQGNIASDIALPTFSAETVSSDHKLPALNVLTVDSGAIFQASWRGWVQSDSSLPVHWSGVEQTLFIEENDNVFVLPKTDRDFTVNTAESLFVLDRVSRTFVVDDEIH